MENEFKPLAEEDFKSPEEFAAFKAKKQDFIEKCSRVQYGRDFEDSPLLSLVNQQENEFKRSRMIADLVHDEALTNESKVALAKAYFFKKSPDRKNDRSQVPSLETMVILIKSAQESRNRIDIPQQLTSPGSIRIQLEADIPHLTLDDYRTILALEKKHKAGTMLSKATGSNLDSQFSKELRDSHNMKYVNNLAENLHALADMTGDHDSIARTVQDYTKDLPEEWQDEPKRIRAEKIKTHEALLRSGLRYNARPPVGKTPEEQIENLGDRISKIASLVNSSADNALLRPDEIIDAIGQLKKYSSELGVNVIDRSYEIGPIMEKFKKIVDTSIGSNKATRLQGFNALMDMRTLVPNAEGGSYSVNIYSNATKIAEKANHEEALAIYESYEHKAPLLTEKNSYEDFSGSLVSDIHKRLSAGIKDDNLRSHMMNKMIALSKMDTRHGKPSMNSQFTDLFKTMPVDDKKLLLGKMLNQGFPERSSSELNDLVTIVKDSNDQALTDSAYLLATKSYMKDIQAGDKPDAGYQEKQDAEYAARYMSQVYIKAAGQYDHKKLRGMIREQGALAGMDNAKVGGVLKSVRENYKERESGFSGMIRRATTTVGAFFNTKTEMTDKVVKLGNVVPERRPAVK